MFNLFNSFGRIGQWFTGVLLLTGVFLGLRWLWFRPEMWNGPARGYFAHVRTLQTDSVEGANVRQGLTSALSVKDSIITNLSSEIQTALNYGNGWKARYNQQVSVSDQATDQLSAKQRELAYVKALLANGTLPPAAEALPVSSSEVVGAGLKTANREALAHKVNDSLSTALGYYQAANERLGKGLTVARTGLTQLSRTATANQKGGIWPFNAKRKRQNKALARSADSLTHRINQVSDLETTLNRP